MLIVNAQHRSRNSTLGIWPILTIGAIVVFAGSTTPPVASAVGPTTREALERLEDPRISEDEFWKIVKAWREIPARPEDAVIFARIANSDRYSGTRRRRAVLQLLDRFVPERTTVGEVAKLLNHPTWLQDESIGAVRSGNGLPHEVVHDTSYYLRPYLPANDRTGVYISLNRKPPAEQLLRALKGEASEISGYLVLAVVVMPRDPRDAGLVRPRGRDLISVRE